MIKHRDIYQVPMVRCPLNSYKRVVLEECKLCTFHEGEVVDNVLLANYVKCSYQGAKEED